MPKQVRYWDFRQVKSPCISNLNGWTEQNYLKGYLLPEVVVDEGHRDADLGQADDVGHVLGLVLHQQGDDVTTLQVNKFIMLETVQLCKWTNARKNPSDKFIFSIYNITRQL